MQRARFATTSQQFERPWISGAYRPARISLRCGGPVMIGDCFRRACSRSDTCPDQGSPAVRRDFALGRGRRGLHRRATPFQYRLRTYLVDRSAGLRWRPSECRTGCTETRRSRRRTCPGRRSRPVDPRLSVTAGFAKDVEAVNQYADVIVQPRGAGSSCRPPFGDDGRCRKYRRHTTIPTITAITAEASRRQGKCPGVR